MIQNKIFAAILMFALAISCSKAPQPVIVEGRIIGADGKTPILAHVNITKPDKSIYKPANFIQADSNGYFKIKLPSGRYWKMTFTAVNHTPLALPLFLTDDDHNITVDVTLSKNQIKENLEDVRIIGEWNEWSFSTADKMVEKNGKFVFETSWGKDSAAYQIINVTNLDRSINGSQADLYRYDEEGDYESVLKVENGLLQIEFDPELLKTIGGGNEPIVKFSEKNINQQIITDIYLATIKNGAAFIKEVETAANNGQMPPPFDDLQSFIDKYIDLMDNADSELIRKFAAIYLADLSFFGMESDSVLFQKIVDLVPMTDSLWIIKPALLAGVYGKAFGDKKAAIMLYPNLSKLADRLTKAYSITAVGYQARKENDFPRQMEMHKILLYRFSDIMELRLFIDDLDPRQNIINGKAIPNFSFPTIGSKIRVGSKSLLGKYYLLFFWTTYGEESIAEMSGLHQAYKKYQKNNFEILAINMNPFKKSLKTFRENKWKMPWINVHIPQHQKPHLSQDFSIKYIPKMIMVDPDGKIIAVDYELRGKMLDKTLAKYLQPQIR